MKRYDSSIYYAENALKLLKHDEDNYLTKYLYINVGSYYYQIKNYSAALVYCSKAIQLYQQSDNVKGLVDSYELMAALKIKLGKYGEAEATFTKALNLSKSYKLKSSEASIYKGFSELDSAKGNFRKALNQYKKYSTLHDSLVVFDQRKELSELYVLNETIEKEKENALLKKDRDIQEKNLALSKEENKLATTIILSVIIGLILSMLAVLALVKNIGAKQKAFIEVTKLNEELIIQKQKLLSANEEIKTMNDNLESIVKSRTEKIEAQKEQLTEFAFFNAHKVRGPLARIIGLIYLFKRQKALQIDEFTDRLEIVASEMDQVLSQINQLLEEKDSLKKE
jgi:tetratricopeptide (TPR) repeat protein